MLSTLNRTVQSSFRTFRKEVEYTINLADKVFAQLEHAPHGRGAKASLGWIVGHVNSWVIDLEPIADQDPVIQQMVWQMKNAIGQLQDAQRCVEPYAFQVSSADVRYAQFKVKDVKRILQGIERQLVRK
jgi:hypothetical protein